MNDLPQYGLAMIVRNEAEGIRQCLESVRPHIGYYVISDTGSTDSTMDIIREVLDGVPGELIERYWRNFGENRSDVFAAVRGHAQVVLALDADMTVEIDPDFEPDPAVDCYMIRMGDDPDFAYRLPLLLRGDLPWESRGPVHEYTCLPDRDYIGVPTDKVRVALHGDRSSPEKSRWHLGLLEAEMAEHPDNSRAVFYAANSCFDLGDKRAIALYEKRAKMGGYAEEVYYSLYRLGLLLPTWPARLQSLIAAWEMRPQRLEAPYEIARSMNAMGQHHSAYRFASVPIVPTTDALFVHASVWRWGLDFERHVAAFYATGKDECRVIGEDLLTRSIPDHIRAQILVNLTFC
jgi:glycosyltransferase involved in cell wall biosynthesis